MIYVKTTAPTGEKMKIGLTDNCFFSDCPVCGSETHVDFEILEQIVDDGDLEGTSVYCDSCAVEKNKKPHIHRIK